MLGDHMMSNGVATSAERSEATLAELGRWLAMHWWRMAICMVICGVATFLVVRQMPLQYTASATIIPAGGNHGDPASGTIAGLASLAGISAPGRMDQSEIGLALLESRAFLDGFIAERRLLDELLEEETPQGTPTAAQRERAFKRFTNLLDVKRGIGTDQLIRIQITSPDPVQAASWVNGLVERVNAELRRRAIASAQQRKAFLETELVRNQNVELRLAIADMIANELKTLMTSRQPQGFAFEVLDPAIPPTKPSGPRFVVLTAAGALFGLLCGLAWALISGTRPRA